MIESRFHIAENENTTTEKRTPQKNANRRFGAKLSTNTFVKGNDEKLTPKKIVRVRRTVSSSKSKERKTASINKSTPDEVVVFAPGPVGLQLEPNQKNPSSGCQIVRFVDGGPNNPGQARKSEKLKPGDLVTQVEANGVVGSSYDDIVEILKDSCATRTVTFRSIWSSSLLDSHSKSSGINTNKQDTIPERPLTPNAHNLSSVKRKISTPVETSASLETLLPPPFFIGSESIRNQKEELGYDRFDITLIHSPSQAALLPHVRTPVSHVALLPHARTPLSHAAPLPHMRTPPSHAVLWSHIRTPSSLPGNETQHQDNKDGGTTINLGSNSATPPLFPQIPIESVPRVLSRRNSPYLPPPNFAGEGRVHNVSILEMQPKCQTSPSVNSATDPIPSVDGTPCIVGPKESKSSLLFSPSSVRKLSMTEKRNGRTENAIVSRVFGRLHKSVVPTVASPSYIPNSSNTSTTTGRMNPVVAALGADPHAAQNSGIVQTISFSSGAAEGIDNTKALVLQELRCAKIAKDEQDIAAKELERTLEENKAANYLHIIESNTKLQAAKTQHVAAEKKIKELYASKYRHQQSKILEMYSENQKLSERLQDTRGTTTADSIHLSTVQETLHRTMGKLESKRKEADELERQNGQFQERLSLLEVELETYREREKSLLLELEMSRTMAKEMERRVLQVEASSVKSVEALEGDLLEKEEELKTTRSFVSQLKGEGGDLFAHMNSLETGVKALQDENEQLRWECDRAKTELAESKNEIAAIHENLLQNLENGASCLHVHSGGDDCDYSNVETSLAVTEQMKDVTARYRASRCALVVFMIREKILEDRSTKHLIQLDALNEELLLALEKSQQRGRLNDAELENRNKEVLSLKRGAEEMETSLHKITASQIQDRDQHFKKLLKVGACIDPQSMTAHHLISAMRRNTEVLQVSLSRMERNLELVCSSQLEQKDDLQVAMESENELKSKLEVTMEKLSSISIKLRLSEQEKADNDAALRDSEETLSDAVEVIKKLEADVETKDRDLESAEARINELKENEDVLSSEHIGLYEKILVLEERLTESTENICKLRRTCNSVESRKSALEMKIQTMADVSEDMKKSLLDNKVLQTHVNVLNDKLKTCKTELDQAHATKSLLESDLMDLLDKSEDLRRNESSKMEQSMHQLLAKASRESDLRHALQQKLVETTQTLESLKQKHSALNIAFLASMGISDTKNQFHLHANKTLERAVNERMRDIKELKQVVSSSQGKIEDLRGDRQSLQIDLLQLEHTRVAETHGSKCDIEALESALDSSKTQHLATRASLQKGKEMLSEVTVQRDALQSRIAEARDEEVSLLRSTVRRAQFRYCASSAAIEGMNRLSSKTAEDLAMKNSQIGSLADQIFNIEDEVKYIEDNYELENRLLRERIDELRRTVCSLLAASISEHFRSRKDDTRAGDTKATISRLQTELDCTRSKLLLAEADLRESSIAHKNEKNGIKEKVQSFEDQIEDFEQRLRLSREECNSKTREIRSLQMCSAKDQDRILGNLQLFEGERKRLLATIFDMAEEISIMKRDIEDLQEDRISEIEDGKILLENLKCDRESILATLAEAKKKAHDEEQRKQTSKVELDSLKRTFDELHSEKLANEGSIRVLEKRVEELVGETSTRQRESNEWQSRAESFNIKLQAMATKYSESVVEIAHLLEKNETEHKHLNRSEAMVASLNKQQTINESELKKNGIIIAKVEEEKENALWERDEAKVRLDVLGATDTQLRRKVEMLAMEKHRLLNDRCIAEAALVGLHQQSVVNRRIFSPKDQETPETMPRVQQLRSLEGTLLADIDSNAGNSSCTESEPTRDVHCTEGTSRNHEVSLTRDLETSSKTLVNLNGNGRLVGARLLSRVVEQKMRMEVAGAFRKWSCANNAIKATSQLHKTSKELSQQLHCTREKLLVLKSHIKATSSQRKESEPRLRKVLMPLTNQQRLN